MTYFINLIIYDFNFSASNFESLYTLCPANGVYRQETAVQHMPCTDFEDNVFIVTKQDNDGLVG